MIHNTGKQNPGLKKYSKLALCYLIFIILFPVIFNTILNRTNNDTLQNSAYLFFFMALYLFPFLIKSLLGKHIARPFLVFLIMIIFVGIGLWFIYPTIGVSSSINRFMVNTDIDPVLDARFMGLFALMAILGIIAVTISSIRKEFVLKRKRLWVRILLKVTGGALILLVFLAIAFLGVRDGLPKRVYTPEAREGVVVNKRMAQDFSGETVFRDYFVGLQDFGGQIMEYQIPRYIYDVLGYGEQIEISYDPVFKYVVGVKILENHNIVY